MYGTKYNHTDCAGNNNGHDMSGDRGCDMCESVDCHRVAFKSTLHISGVSAGVVNRKACWHVC